MKTSLCSPTNTESPEITNSLLKFVQCIDLRKCVLAFCFFSHFNSHLAFKNGRHYKIPNNSNVVGFSRIPVNGSICLPVSRYIYIFLLPSNVSLGP